LGKKSYIQGMKPLFPAYSIGHFIGQPGNPTEFAITRFADISEADVADIDDPHRHTFYEIMWIDAGISTQFIDYQEYEISGGMLFFISPGQLHHFETWQPLQGGSVFFTESFLLLNHTDKDRLFELTFLDNFYTLPYLQPTPTAFAEIGEVIDLLLREQHRPNASTRIQQSLLHVLLAQIQRCVDTGANLPLSKKYVVTYKQFKHLIDTHFTESLTAADYADRLNITPHHLNLIAKTVTGKTTTELIRARCMLEAKRLLTYTDSTVSEIAMALGYQDLAYFGRVFRAESSLSPLQFKQTMSEKYRLR
jgi:AraC family transcriptional regulator, transcriptional activator of pobA